MALLSSPISVEDCPEGESQSFELIKPGWYPVKITNADLRDSSTGGQYIKLELTIQGESNAGRKIWTNLNIVNQNEKTVAIAREQLGKLMTAGGLKDVNDTDELMGIDVDAKVKISPARDGYEESNDIAGFRLSGSAPAPVAESAPKKAPWQRQK